MASPVELLLTPNDFSIGSAIIAAYNRAAFIIRGALKAVRVESFRFSLLHQCTLAARLANPLASFLTSAALLATFLQLAADL